jgi:hypothetical protein
MCRAAHIDENLLFDSTNLTISCFYKKADFATIFNVAGHFKNDDIFLTFSLNIRLLNLG